LILKDITQLSTNLSLQVPLKSADNVLVMGETLEQCRRIWPWAGLILIAYLFPFAVWVFDGMFYHGRHYQSLGGEAHHLFQVIYWPLLQIIRSLFG
jgi:hypothetical protein